MKKIPLTIAIIGLNIILFFIILYIEDSSIVKGNALMILRWGGNFNPYTIAGEYYRLFSSLFLHFNIFHLLVNIHSLFHLGKIIEKQVGGFLFLSIYFLCGIAGGISSLYFNIFVISAGASGAIFGLYGFVVSQEFILHHRNRKRFNEILINFAIFLVINIIITKAFNIDIPGHLGGLAFGTLTGLLYSTLKRNFSSKPTIRISFYLVASTLSMLLLFNVVPKFQMLYFNMFENLVENEKKSANIMRGYTNDLQLKNNLIVMSANWDSVLLTINSLTDLPDEISTDSEILKEYIGLRKEDLRFRVLGIEKTSYIYRDSIELVSKALNELPAIKFALNFNIPDSIVHDTITEELLKPTTVFYDSIWIETSENLAEYYRTGYKDSLGEWSGRVNDYYLNGKIQMKGEYYRDLKYGIFIYYSPDQKYEAAGRYEKEFKVGKWEYFYTNGKIFKEVQHVEKGIILNAWDSLGNPLVVNGEGEIRSYFENGTLQISGTIKNGLQEGKWVGYHKNGAPYFEEHYHLGDLTFGRSVTISGERFNYDASSIFSNPEGGYNTFEKYLRENIRFPEDALTNNVTGKVTLKFTVELDGSLSNFVYLNKIGYGCDEEAKRLVLEGPKWFAGRVHGHEIYRSENIVTVYFD